MNQLGLCIDVYQGLANAMEDDGEKNKNLRI